MISSSSRLSLLGLALLTGTLMACGGDSTEEAPAASGSEASGPIQADFPVSHANYDQSFDIDYDGMTAAMYAYKPAYHMKYMLDLVNNTIGSTNKIDHTRQRADHNSFVITPALDHIYTKAVIDVRQEPQVITVPEVDQSRYYSILLTNIEHYADYDVIQPPPGTNIMVVRKGWVGSRPEGVDVVVETPGNFTHLLIRTQVFTDDDIANANEVQDLWSDPTGLTEFLGGAPLPNLPMEASGEGIGAVLQFALDNADPFPETEGYLGLASESYDEDTHQAAADLMLEAYNTRLYTSSAGGFEHIYSEDADNDPYFRAFVMQYGHLGLPVDHAYYELMGTRCDGTLLTGAETFSVTLPYDPGVDNFWSITRYDGATRLPIADRLDVVNRYNSQPDENGNFSITFSVEDAGVNDTTHKWVGVNPGPYYLIARYYGPTDDMATLGPTVCGG